MLTLAFITCMNSIEPAIGELHQPFSLILPTWRIHAAEQTYGFILLTSSTHFGVSFTVYDIRKNKYELR